MISIKRLLDQRGKESGGTPDLIEALRQMGGLLLDGMATHIVPGREGDLKEFRGKLTDLTHQLEESQSPVALLHTSSDAVEALDNYCRRTTSYLIEGHEQMRSMVRLLAEAVAEISGQTDASMARLQAIEKQVEQTSELDDTREIRANLEECLLALREAASQQRLGSVNTVKRLEHEIGKAQGLTVIDGPREGLANSQTDFVAAEELSEKPLEGTATVYVAAFKLQRAEHIVSHFGEGAKNEMLAVLGKLLKLGLGPDDRLLRWKGISFVLFLRTNDAAKDVRRRLLVTATASGQQVVEVGKKAALLRIAVDWIMFPQAQFASLDQVYAEVDAFLANKRTMQKDA